MMIVGKENKYLYKFLKDAFSIMGGSTLEKYLLGDDGTLYFSTFFIKGRVEINRVVPKKDTIEEVPANLFSDDFYTLKMRDDKSFELKEDASIISIEEQENERAKMFAMFKDFKHVRELESIRTTLISTIHKETDIYVPDRFLGLIKKMGECELLMKGKNIMIIKEEHDDKQRLSVKTSLLFVCEHDQPGGFNDAETRLR